MLHTLDTFFERLEPEARMLWAFIQGNVLMMSMPVMMWYRVIEEKRPFILPDFLLPSIAGVLLGGLWGSICWSLMRFRFSYASERFINFTRISFHLILPMTVSVFFSLTNMMRPDPPGYISHKEVFFVLLILMLPIVTLLPREAIYKTTRTYLELLDQV